MLRRIRSEGALTIRDIDDDVLVEKDHPWASRKPSKRALQLAFYRGLLTVSERDGHAEDLRADRPALRLGRGCRGRRRESEILTICSTGRCARRASSASIRSATSTPAQAGHAAADRGAGAPQGAGAGRGRGRRASRSTGRGPRRSRPAPSRAADLVHILSPFDPLVIQRKRLQLFFGYEHRFEAYVPKEKRVFGYFALPVLVGDDIVAAIDLKTDREQRKLLMQQWTWVGEGRRARTSGGSRRRCTASSASSSRADPQIEAKSCGVELVSALDADQQSLPTAAGKARPQHSVPIPRNWIIVRHPRLRTPEDPTICPTVMR